MKGIRKPVVEFVGWRWAPTVGLLSAALLYVLIVVALVPDEIGGPVPNAKVTPTRTLPIQTAAPDQTSTFAARTEEEAAPPVVHAPPPPAPVSITPAEFGRRGFSPPLERPPAPPEPVITPPPPPPPPPPPVVPPPPQPDPALVAAAQPQNPMMQRGLVGAAFNAARRVAGQVENNITGHVPPAPGQPGAAPAVPLPPPEAPGAAPGAQPAPSADAPPPAPPVPVQ
jgi:hypothetical protein